MIEGQALQPPCGAIAIEQGQRDTEYACIVQKPSSLLAIHRQYVNIHSFQATDRRIRVGLVSLLVQVRLLHDTAFLDRLTHQDPLEAEPRQINRPESSVQ